MIRYFYSLCLILVCIALPMRAEAKALLPTTSSDSADKPEQSHKTSKTATVSKDKTTSTATASVKEAKTPAAKATPSKEAKTEDTKTTKASTSMASTTTASSKKRENTAETAKASSDGSSKGEGSTSRRLGSMMTRIDGRLARLTAYWAGEGDYYTGRCISATGVRLHGGHCAVDPSVIPYGSQVEISGLGTYLAVDTGSAVITRKAARETGHTSAERNALVIDIFFESRHEGERFAANGPKFANISWRSPREADNQTKESAGLIAEESWNKNHNREL